MLKEFRFAGIGGQGAVTAGKVFAEAAAVSGLHATYTSQYGGAARGGPAASSVRVSDEPVLFPWVLKADVLVAMHQDVISRYKQHTSLKPDGALVIDPLLVTDVPDDLECRVVQVRFRELAQQAGRAVVGNIVAVAAVAQITGLIPRATVEQAVLAKVPPGTEGLNQRALALGFAAVPPGLLAA